jgi:hypothetical protein
MLRAKVPALGNTPVKVPLAVSSGEPRPLARGDVAGVAELFQKTFRNSKRPAPASLRSYIAEIFLDHPWQDPDRISKVVTDGEGAGAGFIGVLPLRLQHGEKVIRASVLGSLMSHEPQRNPLVGARLLRSALQANHDLAISESANPLSLKMWEKSGGVTLPLHSLSWMRAIRPAALPLSLLAERFPFASAAVPLTAPLDRLAQRIARGVFSVADSEGAVSQDIEVGVEEFAAAIPQLCTRYIIRPVWDGELLNWLLQQASSKGRYGPMAMRLVKGRRGETVGGYIYYGKPGGIAFALQLFAEPHAERLVVNNLLSHVAARGFAAVRGRVQPEFLDALVRQHAMMFRRSATVVHTRDKELLAALLGGNALITGLAAEAWTQLIGGEFA